MCLIKINIYEANGMIFREITVHDVFTFFSRHDSIIRDVNCSACLHCQRPQNITDHSGRIQLGAWPFVLIQRTGIVPRSKEIDFAFSASVANHDRFHALIFHQERLHIIHDFQFAETCCHDTEATRKRKFEFRCMIGACRPVETSSASFHFDAAQFGKITIMHKV